MILVDLSTATDAELLDYALAEIDGTTIDLAETFAAERIMRDEQIAEYTDPELGDFGFEADDIELLRLSEDEEKDLPADKWLQSSLAREHMLLVSQAFDFRPRNTSPKSKNLPSLDWSPKQNWVDKKGVMKSSGDKGLPEYISRLAKQFTYAKKLGRQTAIKWAVAIAKRWCATGAVRKSGEGKLNPGSRSQACAAVKQWEQMKGRA